MDSLRSEIITSVSSYGRGNCMSKVKFFICQHCKNIVEMVKESGVPIVCCGEDMKELVPNTTDAALEKHVPVVVIEGNSVKVEVGSVIHPMTSEHYIQFICLETDKGIYRRMLNPTDDPKAEFALTNGEKPITVYEYCNLHGLWKKDL